MSAAVDVGRHAIAKANEKGCRSKGPFKCYVTQMGVGGVKFSEKLRYEGVIFNFICVTRGWVGVQFPGKKRYVTLEWPQIRNSKRREAFI